MENKPLISCKCRNKHCFWYLPQFASDLWWIAGLENCKKCNYLLQLGQHSTEYLLFRECWTLKANLISLVDSGELGVFQSVVPSLQKGIGAEAVEWKRAYGRTTKHVHLHPRFIPFNSDEPCASMAMANMGESTNPAPVPACADQLSVLTLLDQPMLHTYWTDCVVRLQSNLDDRQQYTN